MTSPRTAPSSSPGKPLFLVIEDGDEYVRRFARFFGATFSFTRAASLGEAVLRLAEEPACVGLLLDLDFRRTPREALVDETGRPLGVATSGAPASLAAVQGILILQALRQQGVRLPAWLFADLDDAGQVAYLQTTLAPLRVLSSAVGLPEVSAFLTAALSASRPAPR